MEEKKLKKQNESNFFYNLKINLCTLAFGEVSLHKKMALV